MLMGIKELMAKFDVSIVNIKLWFILQIIVRGLDEKNQIFSVKLITLDYGKRYTGV